jgi:hypothetical protein
MTPFMNVVREAIVGSNRRSARTISAANSCHRSAT